MGPRISGLMAAVDGGGLVMGPEEVFPHYLERVIGLQIRRKRGIANASSDRILSNCLIGGGLGLTKSRSAAVTHFVLDNTRRIGLSHCAGQYFARGLTRDIVSDL